MKPNFTFQSVMVLLSWMTPSVVSAQSLLWETHATPDNNLMTDPRAMAHDADGNIVVAGYYYSFGDSAFVDSENEINGLPSNANEINAFVAKYTPAGQLIWARPFLGTALGHAYGVAVDGSGDIYVTGMFVGTVDFNGGPSDYPMTVADMSEDGFLVKYRGSGEFMWARQFPSSGYSEGHSVAVSNLNEIYVTGAFSETMDLDPTAVTLEVSSNGERDIFVAKYDVVGNIIWAKSFGGPDIDLGMAITADEGGTVTLVGMFSDTVDFDPDPVAMDEHVSPVQSNAFTARFDSTGELVFARTVAAVYRSSATTVVSDADGNSYVGGQYYGTLDLDPLGGSDELSQSFDSFSDGFVMKYDPAGNMVWGKSLHDASIYSGVTDLAIDDFYGRLYVSASYNGVGMDADPGPGTEEMSYWGVGDLMFGEYDLDGNMIWARSLGGNYEDEILGMVVNTDGSLCIAGYYSSDELDVDPSSAFETIPGSGNRNLLIASYGTSALGIDAASESAIALYPNPTDGGLSVTFAGHEAVISVTDLHGKTVIVPQKAVSGSSIDLQTLTAGVYLVRVSGEQGDHTARVVKR